MINKKLKQIIAAMSVIGAIVPFNTTAVTTYAREPSTKLIMSLTEEQKQNTVTAEEAAQIIADSPVLKALNQTPKTPVDEIEKNKQKIQSTLPKSAQNISSGSNSASEPKEQKPIYGNPDDLNPTRSAANNYTGLQQNSTSASSGSYDSSDTVETLNIPVGNAGKTADMTNAAQSESTDTEQTQDSVNSTESLPQMNALTAAPALLAGTTGAALIGTGIAGAALIGIDLLGTAAFAAGTLPATAILGIGTAVITAGVTILGAGALLGAAAGLGLAGLATVAVPAALTGLAGTAAASTALTLGRLAAGAAIIGTSAIIASAVGAAALGGTALTAGLIASKMALDVATASIFTTTATAAIITGAAVMLGALAVGATFAVGTGILVAAIVTGHIFRRIVELGILALGAAAVATDAVIFGEIALALGIHFTFSATRLALFSGVVLASLLLIGTTLGLGIMAGIAFGAFLSIAAMITTFVVLGAIVGIALTIGTILAVGTALALGAVIGLMFLTGAAIVAMLLIGAVTGFALLAGIIFGLFLLGGVTLASLITLGAVIAFGALAALSFPLVLLAGFVVVRLLAVPTAILTWGNIGRAWGRFIGALIGAVVSFFVAGLLGSIFSLPLLRPAFAALWQLICVPLWSALGAFNGALICTPIGMFLGAGIGLLFPLWSLAIGTWFVPMFALLWDSLATTQIVLTTLHMIAGLLGLPIGMLTWGNVGRAWGGFIGSWVGAFVSFILAGALGFLFGLPGLRLAFAWLWQVICVPLWSILGAVNGAVICGILGIGLGAILGMTVPLWSILIGSWFVPMFALLWDALTAVEIIGAHVLSVTSQWFVRYPLRWAHMNAFVFIPGALKSLFNILTLRYGPLFNHIHKITAFSDSVDSGWGSLGYLLYGKTVVANRPVLDSAPWLVGYALGAWVNQYSIPGGRTSEIRFLLDPFYLLPDYNLRNQMEELSNGSISFWKLLLMKFFARMSVRTSQVITINIGSNDLWVPLMSALYDIANDGRFGLLTTPERVALFGKWPTMIGNIVHYVLAWYIANALSSYNPTKPYFLAIKLIAGVIKEFTDFYINLPLILLHIFLLNPFATVVVEGTESPVRNWDVFPGLDDNLIEYAMEPVYEMQNLYKRLLVLLYPGKAVYADMHGIQLKTERFAVPTFENLTLDASGFDPHPSWIGRRQQADRILRALGQPSPYGWSESVYLRPSVFWNFIYPWRPTTFIHPLWSRFRPLDGIHFRPLYNFQTILPSVTGKLPINY